MPEPISPQPGDSPRRAVRPAIDLRRGEPVTLAEIEAVPLLRDAARFIAQHPACIRRRRFEAGEAICRQGDSGRTAYYLTSGRAVVHLERRTSRPKAKRSLLDRVARLVGAAPGSSAGRPILADGAVVTSEGRLAELQAGDLFGEIACLTRQPRSATVTAAEPCEVYEIIRTVLERLRDKSEAFRAVLAEADRRKLGNLLRVSAIFRDLRPETLELITRRARAVSFAPGAVIFPQGAAPDALYIIRIGQVRVTRALDLRGEITVGYLTQGDVFGEMGILDDAPRSATCSAYGHETDARRLYAHPAPRNIRPTRVELFRIDRADCEEALATDARFKRRLERLAARRRGERPPSPRSRISLPLLAPQVERLGLAQGRRVLMIDLERCTRCDQCVQACVASHDDGLTRLVREGPRLDQYLVPSRCRACTDPVCMIGCPVGSIGRRDDLSMIIEDWCIGCGICAENCPYGSIQMHTRPEGAAVAAPPPHAQPMEPLPAPGPVARIAAVCDQCSTLATGPACHYACPHDATSITDWSVAIQSQEKDALGTLTLGASSTLRSGSTLSGAPVRDSGPHAGIWSAPKADPREGRARRE